MKYKYNGQVYDVSIKALDSMPIGSIIQFAGENIPTGWLVCNGDVVSSTDYPDLFAEIGNKYGGTSPSFKLPDLRGRVPVGLDPTDQLEEFDILGNSGGSRYLQAHTHKVVTNSIGQSQDFNKSIALYNATDLPYSLYSATGEASIYPSGTTGTGNSGNLQPYLVVNFIIKAKNTTPTMASIVDDYSTSTQDGYSCNYVNEKTGVVLYENSSGTTGNVSLSDSISNYRLLEIHYYNSDWQKHFVSTIPTEYGDASICSVYVASSSRDMYTIDLTLSSSTITKGDTRFSSNGGAVFTYNIFRIIKVIGYK